MTTSLEKEQQRYDELLAMALDHARAGETEALRTMLEHQLPANLADHQGNTLLMLAAYHDHPQTVQLLLDFGAEPDRRNDRGQTPLAGVAFKGYAAVAAILLAAGADPLASQGVGAMEKEMTPLDFAKMFARTEVQSLLEKATSSL
ncbi:MAG: ankyrin repeat domain-containing protein [Chthoniobacterales bacterium]|nr:ankyrin repeat domain-containing protein [Chthoniobacterales bacterium]